MRSLRYSGLELSAAASIGVLRRGFPGRPFHSGSAPALRSAAITRESLFRTENTSMESLMGGALSLTSAPASIAAWTCARLPDWTTSEKGNAKADPNERAREAMARHFLIRGSFHPQGSRGLRHLFLFVRARRLGPAGDRGVQNLKRSLPSRVAPLESSDFALLYRVGRNAEIGCREGPAADLDSILVKIVDRCNVAERPYFLSVGVGR